jgi:TPP-dependent pyruvate/acetoin dehydrogenase alpha subunit
MRGTSETLRPADLCDDDPLALALPFKQRAYHQMFMIRLVEERLLDLFSRGLLNGTTHTSIGQEANAVAVIGALNRDIDTIWSNHRCHGHFIAYCGQIVGLVAEIIGREGGVCGGRGGSQHLCYRNFHSSGIQGGFAPIAVGCAMARKGTGEITAAFLGDGTMGEGMVYESLNLAAVFGAPVLFVVEDNGIAQTTRRELTLAGSIAGRAEAFGIRSFHYDGADPVALHEIAVEAVRHVREKQRPAWLHILTERIGPHSKGDDTRPEWQIARARARDPLPLLRPQVVNADAMERRCRAIVEAAFATALAGQSPTPASRPQGAA